VPDDVQSVQEVIADPQLAPSRGASAVESWLFWPERVAPASAFSRLLLTVISDGQERPHVMNWLPLPARIDPLQAMTTVGPATKRVRRAALPVGVRLHVYSQEPPRGGSAGQGWGAQQFGGRCVLRAHPPEQTQADASTNLAPTDAQATPAGGKFWDAFRIDGEWVKYLPTLMQMADGADLVAVATLADIAEFREVGEGGAPDERVTEASLVLEVKQLLRGSRAEDERLVLKLVTATALTQADLARLREQLPSDPLLVFLRRRQTGVYTVVNGYGLWTRTERGPVDCAIELYDELCLERPELQGVPVLRSTAARSARSHATLRPPQPNLLASTCQPACAARDQLATRLREADT